jgi:dihydrofolate synthase/folylpolyglutamate synthase
MEVLSGDPPLVLDAAHNPDGARALAEALPEAVGDAPIVACLGVLADKDARGVVEALAPRLALVVCTEVPAGRLAHAGRPGARPMAVAELAEVTRAAGLEAETIPAPAAAVRRTLEVARERDGAALVCGSHYLLHDAWTERHAPSSSR